jgi:eukaryotic-like serine/threonine-protein kinase
MRERILYLVREVHRRSLWQVLAMYLVASAAIYEVVVNLVEGLGLPHWVAPSALILLLLGLPLVLATACIHEGGPAGFDPGKPGPMRLWGMESAGDAVSRNEYAATPPAPETASEPATEQRAPAAGGDRARPHHRLFTWRRTTTAIVLGFAVLGLVTSGFMGMRALGIGPAGTLIARGDLEPLARILIADFAAPPTDSLLADAVAAALRIDLPQSPVLQVVDPSEIRLALRRMGRTPADRLDEDAALELAIRDGIPAVLVGDVTPVGSGYQIAIRLLAPHDARVLFRGRETAADTAGVLSAVDRLSGRLRERAGESLRSVRASPPLAKVTTPSLEALQLYSAAKRANVSSTPEETRKAIRLLEAALEQDSLFAMAWHALGINLGNAGIDRPRRLAAFTRAVALEDRLTDVERYMAHAAHFHDVLGDMDRAIDAYERVLELNPDHAPAHNNLGLLYAETADYRRAATSVERAVRADSTALSLANLFLYRIAEGDTMGARHALQTRQALYPDNRTNSRWVARLDYVARDDRRAVQDTLEALLRDSDPLLQPLVLYDLACLEAVEGRARASRRLMERSAALQREQGRPAAAVQRGLNMAWVDLMVLGHADLAVEGVARALDEYDRLQVPALQRDWFSPALLLALTGDTAQARALMERWALEVPDGPRRLAERGRMLFDGVMACADDRWEEGLDLQRRATERTNHWVSLPMLALAYDMAGKADEALITYHRYEDHTHWSRLLSDALFRALAYERMAQLHEGRGEIPEAVHYYQRFVDLWKDADPELQPRVQAAQRALARIASETQHPW